SATRTAARFITYPPSRPELRKRPIAQTGVPSTKRDEFPVKRPVRAVDDRGTSLGGAIQPDRDRITRFLLALLRHGGPVARELDRGALPARRPVDEGDKLLRREEAIALGEELRDLRPVDVVVDHHADFVGAPARPEERMAAVPERIELRGGRAERHDDDRTTRPRCSRVRG